jgi:hypothetical protein
MEIYKVNSSLSTTDKIDLLNDMLLQLEGLIAKAEFDKNEIEALYEDLGSAYTRKYLRDVLLGNTLTDYTDWTHLKAETGYGIWKITPDNYSYDAINQLCLDDKLLENRGEADSESATAFDKVYVYEDSAYTDVTTDISSEGGDEVELISTTDGYLYVGLDSTFEGIKFEFYTRGSNYTLKVEYFDESSAINDWNELTLNDNDLLDDTSNFESDGRITWTAPADWGLTTVNSVSKYWIRISTTTTPITVAEATYIIPGNSVVGLLALSSEEVLQEEWAWCSYNDTIYVTIRNSGNTAYEGDYYISSSSSATNLKNFFIYNHTFSANHLNSAY